MQTPVLGRIRVPTALLALAVVVIAGAVIHSLVGLPPLRVWGIPYRIDVDVYRLGAGMLADGNPLYGQLPPTRVGLGLPFTYPPIAAILFLPFAWMPLAAASVLITVLSLIALALVVALVVAAVGVDPQDRWRVGTVVLAVALLLEPVVSTLDFGQINLLLMLMIVADCLLPRTLWPRGLLLGIAAAIKLTPLTFVLFFVLRRDLRAIVMTAVGFLATTALAAVALPSDTVEYFSRTLLNSDRIGTPAYVTNQSITGMLARMDMPEPARTIVWFVLCLVVLAVTIVAVLRCFAADRPVLGLGAVALAGLLCSPVSWSHHWVWVIVLIVALLADARSTGRRFPAVWAGVWVLATTFAPHVILSRWEPGRDLGWPLIGQLTIGTYVLLGVLTLVLPATGALIGRPADRVSSPSSPADDLPSADSGAARA
ncbi:glycosyltransferase 87 family protein [Millisia brevis]|uniref:glycosyltransferase 87 family protein n=1 Tax=Millisia brevis TaxID=264148 RepID=UPI0008338AC5|nr:glycosyltransferase 87 family protein [Millisia brevis]